MSDKIIPSDFFKPILTGVGPVETQNHRSRLMRNCDFDGIAVAAIERARAAGTAGVDQSLVDCKDDILKLFARVLRDGPETLQPFERAAALDPITSVLKDMALQAFAKISSTDGYFVDPLKFAPAMSGARRKMEAFLEDPKLNLVASKFPRGTSWCDRGTIGEEHPTVYLLQIDGWHASVLEKQAGLNEWHERSPEDDLYPEL